MFSPVNAGWHGVTATPATTTAASATLTAATATPAAAAAALPPPPHPFTDGQRRAATNADAATALPPLKCCHNRATGAVACTSYAYAYMPYSSSHAPC